VSGNVSLYNETDGVSIAPTPMIGMVGKMRDVRSSPPALLRRPAPLYLLHAKATTAVFGGSLAAKALGLPARGGAIPAIDWAGEREAMEFLRSMVGADGVLACRDVGDGGIALTAAKMVLGATGSMVGSEPAGLGLNLDLSHAGELGGSAAARYFGELGGAYLIAFKESGLRMALQAAGALRHNTLVAVGEVLAQGASGQLEWGGWVLPLEKAQQAFASSI
jgi:phosphoribosylformylglycinamidine synthase